MRHLKKRTKFSRSAKEARRLLRNILTNLILYERIETTEAKAKKARRWLDRLVNIGKKGDLSAYRQLLKFFFIKQPAKKIMEDLSARYPVRNSGYSRIIRLKRRRGDGAKMVVWELVEKDKKSRQGKTEGRTQDEKIAFSKKKRSNKSHRKEYSSAGSKPKGAKKPEAKKTKARKGNK